VARAVQAEVHQYTFSQVVFHAREYGLTAADAPDVAATLRHASAARFRAELQGSPQPVSLTETQQVFEQSLRAAEIAQELQTAARIGALAKEAKSREKLQEEAKKLRQVESIEVEKAQKRISK
jgi:hypothetical protein